MCVSLASDLLLTVLELTTRATLAPAPPVDFVGKAKWTAWEAIKGKSKDDAKKEYVEKLKAVRFLSCAFPLLAVRSFGSTPLSVGRPPC